MDEDDKVCITVKDYASYMYLFQVTDLETSNINEVKCLESFDSYKPTKSGDPPEKDTLSREKAFYFKFHNKPKCTNVVKED